MIRRAPLYLLGFLLTCAGCSDQGTPLRPAPQSEISAAALDFGTLAVSQSATRSVTISNSGTGKLTGTAVLSCPEYTFQSGGGAFSVPPGGSTTIVVRFTPGAVGSFPCTLALGPDCPAVAIIGAGAVQAPGARCIVLQDSIPFGPCWRGESTNKSLEVLNAGTAPLLVNVVSPCPTFEVVTGGGTYEIAPGTSSNVIIAFKPTEGGRTSCRLALGPGCPDVGVSGIGITVSFANDIQPLLTNRCTSTCHQHPSFTEPQNYDTYYWLVTYWENYPYSARIRAYDLQNSNVYQYTLSGYMPYSLPPIPAEEEDLIREWILEGALKN